MEILKLVGGVAVFAIVIWVRVKADREIACDGSDFECEGPYNFITCVLLPNGEKIYLPNRCKRGTICNPRNSPLEPCDNDTVPSSTISTAPTSTADRATTLREASTLPYVRSTVPPKYPLERNYSDRDEQNKLTGYQEHNKVKSHWGGLLNLKFDFQIVGLDEIGNVKTANITPSLGIEQPSPMNTNIYVASNRNISDGWEKNVGTDCRLNSFVAKESSPRYTVKALIEAIVRLPETESKSIQISTNFQFSQTDTGATINGATDPCEIEGSHRETTMKAEDNVLVDKENVLKSIEKLPNQEFENTGSISSIRGIDNRFLSKTAHSENINDSMTTTAESDRKITTEQQFAEVINLTRETNQSPPEDLTIPTDPQRLPENETWTKDPLETNHTSLIETTSPSENKATTQELFGKHLASTIPSKNDVTRQTNVDIDGNIIASVGNFSTKNSILAVTDGTVDATLAYDATKFDETTVIPIKATNALLDDILEASNLSTPEVIRTQIEASLTTLPESSHGTHAHTTTQTEAYQDILKVDNFSNASEIKLHDEINSTLAENVLSTFYVDKLQGESINTTQSAFIGNNDSQKNVVDLTQNEEPLLNEFTYGNNSQIQTVNENVTVKMNTIEHTIQRNSVDLSNVTSVSKSIQSGVVDSVTQNSLIDVSSTMKPYLAEESNAVNKNKTFDNESHTEVENKATVTINTADISVTTRTPTPTTESNNLNSTSFSELTSPGDTTKSNFYDYTKPSTQTIASISADSFFLKTTATPSEAGSTMMSTQLYQQESFNNIQHSTQLPKPTQMSAEVVNTQNYSSLEVIQDEFISAESTTPRIDLTSTMFTESFTDPSTEMTTTPFESETTGFENFDRGVRALGYRTLPVDIQQTTEYYAEPTPVEGNAPIRYNMTDGAQKEEGNYFNMDRQIEEDIIASNLTNGVSKFTMQAVLGESLPEGKNYSSNSSSFMLDIEVPQLEIYETEIQLGNLNVNTTNAIFNGVLTDVDTVSISRNNSDKAYETVVENSAGSSISNHSQNLGQSLFLGQTSKINFEPQKPRTQDNGSVPIPNNVIINSAVLSDTQFDYVNIEKPFLDLGYNESYKNNSAQGGEIAANGTIDIENVAYPQADETSTKIMPSEKNGITVIGNIENGINHSSIINGSVAGPFTPSNAIENITFRNTDVESNSQILEIQSLNISLGNGPSYLNSSNEPSMLTKSNNKMQGKPTDNLLPSRELPAFPTDCFLAKGPQINKQSNTMSNIPQNDSMTPNKVSNEQIALAKVENSNQTEPSFICTRHGVFADTEKCDQYFLCVQQRSSFVKIVGACPLRQAFSPEAQRCIRDVSRCYKDKCNAEGNYTDALDDSSYFSCVESKPGVFQKYHLQCPTPLKFMPVKKLCGSSLNSLVEFPHLSSPSYEQKEPTTMPNPTSYSMHNLIEPGYREMPATTNNYENAFIESFPVKDLQTTQQISNAESISRAIRSTTSFECSQDGVFPSRGNCNEYYMCVKKADGGFSQISRNCPVHYAFHSRSKSCSRDLSVCSELWCYGVGNFPDPKDETSYYRCVPNARGGFRIYHIKCPESQVYMPVKNHCFQNTTLSQAMSPNTNRDEFGTGTINYSTSETQGTEPYREILNRTTQAESRHPVVSEKYRLEAEQKLKGILQDMRDEAVRQYEAEQAADGKVFKADGENDNSNSEPSDPDNLERSNHLICKEEGRFPDLNNCRKYYICSKNPNELMHLHHLACRGSDKFDAKKRICVDEEDVHC